MSSSAKLLVIYMLDLFMLFTIIRHKWCWVDIFLWRHCN